jgi:filamin
MQRESQRDRTILCRYDPTEVGDYILHIKWSGEHVPGSPFRVQIFDTQEELERFLINNPHQRHMNTMSMQHSRWNEDL